MIFAFLILYGTTIFMYERELDEAQCEITCEDIENFPDDP